MNHIFRHPSLLDDSFSVPRTEESLEALIESVKAPPHSFTKDTNRVCALILNHCELNSSALPRNLECFESYNDGLRDHIDNKSTGLWLFRRSTSTPLHGVKFSNGIVGEWDPAFTLGLAIVVPSDEVIPDEENTQALKIHFGGRRNLLKNSNVIFKHSEKSRTDRRIKARCYFRIRPSLATAAPEPEIEPAEEAKDSIGVVPHAKAEAAGSVRKELNSESEAVEAMMSINKSGECHATANSKFPFVLQGTKFFPPSHYTPYPNELRAQSDGILEILKANAALEGGSPSVNASAPCGDPGHHGLETQAGSTKSYNIQILKGADEVSVDQASADKAQLSATHDHDSAKLPPAVVSSTSSSDCYTSADDKMKTGQAMQVFTSNNEGNSRCGENGTGNMSISADSKVGSKRELNLDTSQTPPANQVTDVSSDGSVSGDEHSKPPAEKRGRLTSEQLTVAAIDSSTIKAKDLPATRRNALQLKVPAIRRSVPVMTDDKLKTTVEPMPNLPTGLAEALEAAAAKAKESDKLELEAEGYSKDSLYRMALLIKAKKSKTKAIELATAAVQSARVI